MAHTKERGKRRQREMLGEEAVYKIFHTSLLDSSPRACFTAMTCSTEREKGQEKDAISV